MRLYLDDDTAASVLAKLLRNAAHDVQMPGEVGLTGSQDPIHLTYAIEHHRACMTKNHDDFWILHNLIKMAHGDHPGILVVRQDNDPTRDSHRRGSSARSGNSKRPACRSRVSS